MPPTSFPLWQLRQAWPTLLVCHLKSFILKVPEFRAHRSNWPPFPHSPDEVTTRVTRWGLWGSVAAFSYTGWGGVDTGSAGSWASRNSSHTSLALEVPKRDAPHPSDSGLLHFQVRQYKQQLDGHLRPCGGFGQEIWQVWLLQVSGYFPLPSRIHSYLDLVGLGAPQVMSTEPRAGSVLKQKRKTDHADSIISQHLSWLLRRSQGTL